MTPKERMLRAIFDIKHVAHTHPSSESVLQAALDELEHIALTTFKEIPNEPKTNSQSTRRY